MAVICHIDHVSTLSSVERLGALRRLVRRFRVQFDPGTRPTDYNILLQALEQIDVPIPLSTLPESNTLVLVQRDCHLVENDPSFVDVDCTYEHVLDGPNQNFLSLPIGVEPTSRVLFVKGKSSVVQKTTNFYYPWGDNVNFDRQQIQVAHVFPQTILGGINGGAVVQVGDKDFPGLTILQTGEISLPFPQDTVTLEGVCSTVDSNPFAIKDAFHNKINKNSWLNKPALTWLCSDVQFEMLDAAQFLYKFTFEFQFNFDTWDATVAFHDQRTGRPPGDLEKANTVDVTLTNPEDGTEQVENMFFGFEPSLHANTTRPAGYWTVPALQRVDFPSLFGAFFDGV